MSRLIVVGAGPSGLGASAQLALGAHEVRLIDRIPVAGGEAGWSDPAIVHLAKQAEAAGVTLDFGLTGIRWMSGHLFVAGPGRVERLEADHLFYAGGLRPATAADVGLSGERPAGVLPATVAEHLLTAGLALWSTAVVIGDGPWARRIADRIHQYGGRVVAITAVEPSWADQFVQHSDGGVVVGRTHVEALRLGEVEIACDAIILASDPRPNRTVDGALSESDAKVTFVQPTDIHGVEARAERGRQIARAWLQEGAQR